MFSTALSKPGQGFQGFANVYAQLGVETGVTSASPHKLVMMLFDGLLEAMRLAEQAMKVHDVVGKGQALGKAVRILEEGLKAGLNLERGGELASNLRDLYAYIEVRLMQAHLRNDRGAIEESRQLIEPLRDAWQAISTDGQPAQQH